MPACEINGKYLYHCFIYFLFYPGDGNRRPGASGDRTKKQGVQAHAPSNQPAMISAAARGIASRRLAAKGRQPPPCMCAFILAAIDSIRAICFASASRTTVFWAGENVA